jgi:hypothetical protein
MEDFRYADHAHDNVRLTETVCDDCGLGVVALFGDGGSVRPVHLPPSVQRRLVAWLCENLAEHGQGVPRGEQVMATLEQTERPSGYLFDVSVGDATISISDGVSLDAFQMSALIRAATDGLDKIVNGESEDDENANALLREQLAEALGLDSDDSSEYMIRAARNLVTQVGALQQQNENLRAVHRDHAGRDHRLLKLENALRELRAEFTNLEGMPIEANLRVEASASIVQDIDKALEA